MAEAVVVVEESRVQERVRSRVQDRVEAEVVVVEESRDSARRLLPRLPAQTA